MSVRIQFFSNGNVIAFQDHEQMPEIQKQSWFVLYLEWLISQGYRLGDLEFVMPDGRTAAPFVTEDGFNWSMG